VEPVVHPRDRTRERRASDVLRTVQRREPLRIPRSRDDRGDVCDRRTADFVGLEAQTSPSHNVLPSFAGNVSVEQRFADGYGAAVGLTHRSYTTTDASIATVTADRYVGRYRFLYTSSFAHLAGTPGTALTQTIGASMYDARGGELTLRGYAGRDVESAGNGVLVMRVSGASLSGRVPVAGRTSLTYGLDTFTQGGLYSGTGVRLGVKQNF
jgi:YaiO family outer membrane protein